jgi:hypothetical protein
MAGQLYRLIAAAAIAAAKSLRHAVQPHAVSSNLPRIHGQLSRWDHQWALARDPERRKEKPRRLRGSSGEPATLHASSARKESCWALPQIHSGNEPAYQSGDNLCVTTQMITSILGKQWRGRACGRAPSSLQRTLTVWRPRQSSVIARVCPWILLMRSGGCRVVSIAADRHARGI